MKECTYAPRRVVGVRDDDHVRGWAKVRHRLLRDGDRVHVRAVGWLARDDVVGGRVDDVSAQRVRNLLLQTQGRAWKADGMVLAQKRGNAPREAAVRAAGCGTGAAGCTTPPGGGPWWALAERETDNGVCSNGF